MPFRTAQSREMNTIIGKEKKNKKENEEMIRNMTIFYLFLMLFFILHSANVLSNVSLTNIEAPENIEENKLLEIYIYVVSDNNSTINYSIYKNGLLVSENNISNNDITTNNLIFIENIPKAVAKLSDISFESPVETIRDDSAINSIKFSVTEKQFIVSYTINDVVELASIKNVNSIILSKPKISEDIADNQVTGLASYEKVNLTNFGVLQWVVILGIISIIVLSTYYVKLEYLPKIFNQANKYPNNNVRNIKNANTDPNNNVRNIKNANTNPNNNVRNIKNANTVNTASNINHINKRIINKSSVINKTPKPPKHNSGTNNEIVTNEQLLFSNVMKCNELINNLQYEQARTVYNRCLSMMKIVEVDDVEELHKMIYYINIKLQSYRQLHNARRYLYYKNDKALENTIITLDKMYSDIAYHVGFMHTDIIDQELTYLQFIADSKTQLEKYSVKK